MFLDSARIITGNVVSDEGSCDYPDYAYDPTDPMALHYLWVGPPKYAVDTGLRGHDVAGPLATARQRERQTTNNTFSIHFWCLDDYVAEYEEFFAAKDVGIAVHGIEAHLNTLASSDNAIDAVRTGAQQLLAFKNSLAFDTVKDHIFFKDGFALFLLMSQAGYIADTNIVPLFYKVERYIEHGRDYEVTVTYETSGIRLQPHYHESHPRDPVPYKLRPTNPDILTGLSSYGRYNDFYFMFTPKVASQSAIAVFNHWITAPQHLDLSAFDEVTSVSSLWLPNLGLIKESFKSYDDNNSYGSDVYKYSSGAPTTQKRIPLFECITDHSPSQHKFSLFDAFFELVKDCDSQVVLAFDMPENIHEIPFDYCVTTAKIRGREWLEVVRPESLGRYYSGPLREGMVWQQPEKLIYHRVHLMHHAIAHNKPKYVEKMLEVGISPDVESSFYNSQGDIVTYTALEFARMLRRTNESGIIQLLESKREPAQFECNSPRPAPR